MCWRTITGMIAGIALIGMLVPSVARADDVVAGHDLFMTGPGSGWDFQGEPIVADFFGPGSDPFDGVVVLEGLPLGTFSGFGVGDTDTIIERTETAVLSVGGSDTIDIELVALSLSSITPIIVTYSGGQDPEEWDVEVTLGESIPSLGTMTMTHPDAAGGTYDLDLDVYPRFTFNCVGSMGSCMKGDQRVHDFGTYHAQAMTTSPGDWEHDATHGQLVVPDLNGPNSYPHGDVQVTGMQPVLTPTSAGAQIPTVSEWGLVVTLLLALTTGTILLARQRSRTD